MSLSPGSRLGPYEIASLLGAGGMGEVYRATDLHLKRQVALKVLPASVAGDAERLARFQREAEVLAALNHPNIAAIYGLEKTPDVTALVMELVEGEDLSAHIARGPMPLAEVLPIARQIADALEAAHERGIIHRDLKPQNIKVREDGTVKVLDFGLAKALDQGAGGGDQVSANTANSPTMTTPAMTMRGVILGTAAYMAPEQARGKPVDRRADIWAFGCVLYEMVTGSRAFQGDDISITLANVLKEDVKWEALPPDVPSSMRRLLRRCLEKDPTGRLRAMGDARLELDDAALGPPDARPATAPPRTRERFWIIATAVSVLVAATLAVRLWPRAAVAAPPIRFTIPAPEGAPFAFGAGLMAISPDGRQLAFVAGADRKTRLWIRSLESLGAQPLAGTEDAWVPVWSPDSRRIAFNAGRTNGVLLRRVDPAGGPVSMLAPAVGQGDAAWSPSGVVLFTGPEDRLYQVPENGGTPKPVTTLDATRQETAHRWPVFLSDGRRFIYNARSSDPTKSALFLASLDTPGRTHLVDVFSNAAVAGGYIVYQREGLLLAQPFDEERGQIAGDPVPIVEGVDYNPGLGRGSFSLSSTGTLVYRSGSAADATVYRSGAATGGTALTWFDAAGKATGTVGGIARQTSPFRLSPDRTRLIVPRSDGKLGDLWVIDVARGVPARLTFGPTDSEQPVWFPDGSRVAFVSVRGGKSGIYQRAISGAGGDELITEFAESVAPRSFSADGKWLLFDRQMGPGKGWDIWALPMTANPSAVPLVATPFDERDAALSPDGRCLAYQSTKAGGGVQVYVQSYPAAAQEVRVSTGTGQHPTWSADGRQLFYMTDDDRMMAADISVSKGVVSVGVPTQLFQQRTTMNNHYFGFDPVGPRFLLTIEPETSVATPLTVVLNWASGLKK